MQRLEINYQTEDNAFSLHFNSNKNQLMTLYTPLSKKACLFFNISNNNFVNTIEFKAKKELLFNLENFYNSINKPVPELKLYRTSYLFNNKYIVSKHNSDELIWLAKFSNNYKKELPTEI